MAKKNRTPASGEKAAIAGYQAQYEYSACRIFYHMREGTLKGVAIANPEAGIVDDLLVIANDGVHATQIKSENYPSPISLHTELIQHGLIAELASSWQNLEEVHGTGNVRLHYIFPGYFSKRDRKLNSNNAEPRPVHSAAFAAFLSDNDLRKEQVATSQWNQTLGELEKASGLAPQHFDRFISNLAISDNAELIRNRIDS
jgi:hypothetical protein